MNKIIALILMLAMVLALIPAAVAEEDWMKTPGEITAWERQVDFLIVGYGLAGAAAAVEAHDINRNGAFFLPAAAMRITLKCSAILTAWTLFIPPALPATRAWISLPAQPWIARQSAPRWALHSLRNMPDFP